MTTQVFDVTERRLLEYFRYGARITYNRLRFRAYRDPYGKFICRSLIKEAMGNFEIHIDDKPIDNSEEISKEFKRYHYQAMEDTCFHERWAGHSVISFYSRNSDDEKKQYFFKAYEPRDFEYGYGSNNELEYLKLTDIVKVHQNVTSLTNSTIRRSTNDVLSLDNLLHVITRPARKIGEGISRLLSVFDTIVTLSTLSESAMYFVVRMGAGLKVVYVPADRANDEAYIAKIKQGVERWNAANSTVILENPDDGSQTPPKMELLTEHPMDFSKVKDMLLEDIALDTGIPRARIRGIEPGNLEGAKINENSYFDVLEQIQETYEYIVYWMLERLNEFRDWNLPEEYQIVWRKRKVLTETEEAALVSTKVTDLERLVKIKDQIGMSIEELQEFLKIEWKIDKSLIEQAEAQKEAMINSMNNQDSEDNLNNDSNNDNDNDS